MSDADRDRWDERYRTGAYADRVHPTALLAEWMPRLARGRALDVACGAGRNALFLAAAGYDVDAVDISAAGIARGRQAEQARGVRINWIEADLAASSGDDRPPARLPQGPFELIVLVRYVNQPLLPLLVARLAAGGTLVCEQHIESDGDVIGPRTPAYRLKRNALLQAATASGPYDATVLFYREGLTEDPDGRIAALAQLVLRREPEPG